ncbi:MAG: hypothetical protein H6Q88_632, partial [Anaeromyxobacteraceae bacterium]|nr:hypothetical protein [Anaeromyxobacteraceae bacterium]
MPHTIRLPSILSVLAVLALGAISSGCGSGGKPESSGPTSTRLVTVTGEL